jgi:fucose permease
MTARSLNLSRMQIALLLMAYIAFAAIGLPDGLLGVAWPSMRAGFQLPLDALGLLLVASTSGYLTSSFISGRLISKLGVGRLLSICFTLTGASLLGYTFVPLWGILLMLGITAGLGIGAIDAGLNTYVASQYSDGPMQWLHASFGIGVTLGPFIMTLGLQHFGSWRPGYRMVGVFQLALAVCFAFTASLWQQKRGHVNLAAADTSALNEIGGQVPLRSTLRQPGTWLSMILFFLYTGLELSVGHWTYTFLTEARGIDPELAGVWAGSFWGMFTLGRILAGLIAKKIGANRLVRASLLLALIGVIILWWNPVPIASLIGVGLTGFALAPVFPALVSSTVERVGALHTANTIGIQISAAGLGIAVIPSLVGVLARRISLESVPLFWVTVTVLLLGIVLLFNRRPQK